MAASELPGHPPGEVGGAPENRLRQGPQAPGRRIIPSLSGGLPYFRNRAEEKARFLAAEQAERLHTEELHNALADAKELTRSNIDPVPHLSVLLLNTKSSAKTATAFHLGQAFAYATDITTTNFDANHDPALHVRFGYTDEQLPELTSMKKFTAEVQGIFGTKEAYRVLRKIYDAEHDGNAETMLRAQAEAIAAMTVGDIRRLKSQRIRSPLGMGFIAGSTEALTEDEALSVLYGASLVSDYNIIEAGNEIGIATGQTDIRNFVYGVDQLMYTVNVGTKDSWRTLGLNMKRTEAMSEHLRNAKSRPKDADALTRKRQNSIIVISGLDPVGFEYGPIATLKDFLVQNRLIDYHGNGDPDRALTEFLMRHDRMEGKSEFYVGGLPFNGYIRGVPNDAGIAADENYDLRRLQIPTQLAYQDLANTLQYNVWRLGTQQSSRA